MMRKRHLLALLLLSAVQMVYAAPVKQSTAAQTAKSFFAAKGKVLKTTNAAYAPQRRLKSATKEVAPYYVFNAGNNNGFVIVSGDDRIQPILGYVDSGSFDMAKIPAHMRDFLNGYAEQVADLDKENKKMGETFSENADQTRKAVRPLVKCLWDQGDPYYNLCPKDKKGQTVTGCVATAMAQVMHFYQWPATTTEAIPDYKVSGNYNSFSGKVKGVPANTPIDWTNLKEIKYTSSSTATQKKAISELMAYIGRAVTMTYDYAENGGSGASPYSIAPAFNKYFNYSATLVDRNNVTGKEFENIVYKEIASNRPVVFAGNKPGGGGHCFVLDGYDGNGLFHVNWGWGGMANGYFAIPDLDPDTNAGTGAGAGAGGYSTHQYAVIGIDRGTQKENPAGKLQPEFVTLQGSKISVRIANMSEVKQAIEYTLGVREEGKQGVPTINTADIVKEILMSYTYSNRGYPKTFVLKSLGNNKKYRAYVLTRATGTETWQWNEYDYAEVSVDGVGSISSVYNKKYSNSKDLKIKNANIPTLNVVNGESTAEFTIKNDGKIEYNGTLGLANKKTTSYYGNSYTLISTTPVCLQPGQETTIKLTYFFAKPGSNTLYLVDGNDKEIAAHTLNVVPEVKNTTTETKFEFTGETPIVGDCIAGTATITAKGSGFTAGLRLALIKNQYIYQSVIKAVQLDANASEQIPFNFTNVPAGTYQLAFLRYDAGQQSLVFVGRYTSVRVKPAVVMYKKDGTKQFAEYKDGMTFGKDIVAVDFTKVYPKNVTKGENPNTLYYMRGTNVKGLENANKVTVRPYSDDLGKADKIVLNDSYDFACPISFVAKEVTYTRQFKTAYANGKGWETIALPFDVQKVSIEGETIDWYKTKEETGKNFWLMAYDGQENNDVCFRHAPDFLSNTPYVIAVQEKMKNKDIVFSGTDALFEVRNFSATQGVKYDYFGTFSEQNVPDAYILNATGDKFEKLNTPVKPFRAYFKGNGTASALNLKAIGYDKTGIDNVETESTFVTPQPVFELQGRKVATISNAEELNNLPKGIYVVKGKKIVVK